MTRFPFFAVVLIARWRDGHFSQPVFWIFDPYCSSGEHATNHNGEVSWERERDQTTKKSKISVFHSASLLSPFYLVLDEASRALRYYHKLLIWVLFGILPKFVFRRWILPQPERPRFQ